MAWKQIKPFDLSKMGTRPNYCLQNVRLAFGVQPKYADAKSAMIASRNAGTLHDISTLPTDVSVPVFVDTASPYEHVEVSDKGTFYSDGKVVSNPMSQKFFGWSETLNDERIVEYVPDPTPAPEPEPEFKVGDKVIPTKLVDYDGTPVVQYDDYYTIYQLSGDRAVLTAPRNGVPTVWCAMNTANLRKV